MKPGAAPAVAARNRGTGRPRDPIGGHYDPSAGSLLDWDWRKCLVPGNADPGAKNRRGGAPRGAPPSPRRRRASPGVSGGFAGRPGACAKPPRFSALRSLKGRRRDDGVPGAGKEYGRRSVGLLYPSPERGGWRAKRAGWGTNNTEDSPTRPLAEPVIGPRFARTRWLAATLPASGEGLRNSHVLPAVDVDLGAVHIRRSLRAQHVDDLGHFVGCP